MVSTATPARSLVAAIVNPLRLRIYGARVPGTRASFWIEGAIVQVTCRELCERNGAECELSPSVLRRFTQSPAKKSACKCVGTNNCKVDLDCRRVRAYSSRYNDVTRQRRC